MPIAFKLGKCHCDNTGRCCACSARLHLMRLVAYPSIPLILIEPPDALPGEGPYNSSDPYED